MMEITTPRTYFSFARNNGGYIIGRMIKTFRGQEYEVECTFLYYTKKEIIRKLRQMMKKEIKA